MTRHCARQHNAFRRVQILFLNEQEKAGVIEKETSTLAANLGHTFESFAGWGVASLLKQNPRQPSGRH